MDQRLHRFRGSELSGCAARVALCVVLGVGNGLVAQDEPVETPVIEPGVDWAYFKGTEEPDPDWNKLTFNDQDWELGPTPFGYGDTTGGTMLDDMSGNYWSVYLRHVFDLRLESGDLLKFSIAYDDGFVAYLNGEEFFRRGLTGTPPPFDEAATDHEVNNPRQDYFLTCEQLAFAEQGDNVLAIQGHNTSLGSSDLVVDPVLSIVTMESLCPTIRDCEVRTNGSVRVRWTRATGVSYDTIELRRNGVLVEEQPSRPTSTSYTDDVPLPGRNTYEIKVTCGQLECTIECTVDLGGGNDPVFRRGDVDNNASVNLTDASVILNALFQGAGTPACLDAADTNDDGLFNLSDAIFLLGGLFQGAAQPPAPGTQTCGPDPSQDDLADCEYAAACE